jgi:glutamate carboxypeptidase
MTTLVDSLRAREDELVSRIRALVEAESWSEDVPALDACAELLDAIGTSMLGQAAARGSVGGRPYLSWSGDSPRVGLLGHFDTVWPTGTLGQRPVAVRGRRLYGPGVLDMKAGIVQGLAAASEIGLDGMTILLTSDEELGSPHSRPLIEDLARDLDAVLVLEPASGASVKTARKGVGVYRMRVAGRAAHAGLEPELGINATVEAARAVLWATTLADTHAETTVTPTVVRGGVTVNTVPASAEVTFDVRAWAPAELDRVEVALSGYAPSIDGASVTIERDSWRPPLEAERSAALFELASRLAPDVGLSELTGRAVGGGSDGSLTAAIGTPTLDGLGAVGDGAHTEAEYVELDEVAPRAALVAALVDELRRNPTASMAPGRATRSDMQVTHANERSRG